MLYETVPASEGTWIEYLRELVRFSMAIEEDDTIDHEIYTGVSRHWLCKASDRSPTTGTLYHHLAILGLSVRPSPLRSLYYYTKSLCVPIPFSSARESLTNVFNLALSKSPDDTFIRTDEILFSTQS
ncbi:hypothetical protein FOXG_21488 [Fusarium oxysporum f. sp. lycopersici 4287]|uniref:DNA/RNA-binding domain-containing protein n=1 Tax=Fusarium oxysporum f. sp. lycopersici (strain 4287 / CBS 123668 / FGSC 9935 / NRRL 34936) TaxID=426428 RepID=A0A0J9VXW2_FUSO4|nr:hypothetical protein FOXG_21488 [Fusarium oxysporum f. sp. lycopersici 4287]KNB15799.1 hypothetical protein FOXG_21488 [Fusarium oxysporum f. sp. lycopersici 4287]